jgi:hypothetical protein
MSDQPYDSSGKWLLNNEGKALALVGGLPDVVSCQSVQSEVVQPRQLPDGLLEVTLRGREAPLLLLVEFCTYPESRVPGQLMDDIMLVWQTRKVLPEVLAFVLCPKGQATVPSAGEARSELGWTRAAFGWKVVELWNLDAEQLLACPDVGVVPLVPLMRFEGPPEPLFRRCRERIDKEGGARREQLMAVTRTLAGVRFVERQLLDLFIRSEAMIESPVTKEIYEMGIAARGRKDIERAILTRFGKLSDDARARLQGVNQEQLLDDLHTFAIICKTMDDFVERLNRETTPAPKPTSSRRKRKS